MQAWMVLIAVVVCFIGIYTYYNVRRFKEQRKRFSDLQGKLVPGAEVILSDGIYGTIVSIDEDVAMVRISRDVVIKVVRFQIMSLASEREMSSKD